MSVPVSAHEGFPDNPEYLAALNVMSEAIEEGFLHILDEDEIQDSLTYTDLCELPPTDKTFQPLPAERPGALGLLDLEPGIEVVVRDDRIQENDGLISKEVVLSEPFTDQIEPGKEVVVVEAAPFVDGQWGEVRTVNLAIWGIAANHEGLYNQRRWIEPYRPPSNN